MTCARVCLACLLACLTAGFAPAGQPSELQFVGDDSGMRSVPVRAGEAFHVSFVHSQEKTLWVQHYRVAADLAIEQTGSTFGSYGAGMPAGAVARRDEGFMAPVQRTFRVIDMLNARNVQLTLHYRHRRLAIDRWFVPFEHFAVRVR